MKILTFSRDLRTYLLRCDPGLLCLAGALRCTLPSLGALFVWVYFKPPHSDILLLMTPGFLAILADLHHDWKGKIRIVFAAFLIIAIGQFGISVLYQTKFLILIWLFLVTFLSFISPSGRQPAAYASAMCVISLSFSDQGWHMGVNRIIELIIGFIAVLISLFAVSFTLSRFQMRSILRGFLSEIRFYFMSVTGSGKPAVFFARQAEEILRNIASVSLKANNIIKKEEYFYRENILSSEKASLILNYLHSFSRDTLFLENFREQRELIEKYIPLTFPVSESITQRLAGLLESLKKSFPPSITDCSALYEKWREEYQGAKNRKELPPSAEEIVYGFECLIKDICEMEKHLQNKASEL